VNPDLKDRVGRGIIFLFTKLVVVHTILVQLFFMREVSMRKLSCLFLLALGLSVSLVASAALTEESKIYISNEQLIVQPEGMAVDIGGQLIQIFSLFQDEKGYYVHAQEISRYRCPMGHLTPRQDRRCLVSSCLYYCGNPNG